MIGPLPGFDDIPAWGLVGARERARGWTASIRAHQLMVDFDATYPGNTHRQQLVLCPRALAPSTRDRCTSQTFLRHAEEIGYVCLLRSQVTSVQMADVP